MVWVQSLCPLHPGRGTGRGSTRAYLRCLLSWWWKLAKEQNNPPHPHQQLTDVLLPQLEVPPRAWPGWQQVSHSLRSYQRQARSLRRWLELSQEEPGPEDQEAEQQVQKELQEVRPQVVRGQRPRLYFVSAQPPLFPQVELQIQQLASELQARRQPICACITRIQALRQALC